MTLAQKLRDALSAADVWHMRHAATERKRREAEKKAKLAQAEIERLQGELLEANERIVYLNKMLAKKIAEGEVA